MTKTQTMVLEMQPRAEQGSKAVARLRQAGRLPAVVYGHGQAPVSVWMDAHDFGEALHHGHRLFEVTLGGKKETVLVKDLQYDYLGKAVIHADLMRVNLQEMVRVTVPIEQKGTSKGSHFGGMIDEVLDHIEIECRVDEIPDVLPVSVKDLDVGESIYARDIPLPPHAKLVTPPDAVVLHCHPMAKVKTTEELEEELPAAPEVITERAEEEGEGSGE